jgi:hypothetical protein
MSAVIVCTGRSNERKARVACAWCVPRLADGNPAEPRRRWPLGLIVDIFGGYCGADMICGRCGFYWSSDDNRPLRDLADEKRQQNIARVRAFKEPA